MAEIMPQFSHFLHEWAIYGNDTYGRVAVVRPDGEKDINGDIGKVSADNYTKPTNQEAPYLVGVRTILEKYYEVKDHLGNVRLVLMDQKVRGVSPTSEFSAIPVELNNYYPFGMPEAGRSWSYQGEIFESQSKYQDYTYGYNGMQRDNSKGVGSGYTTLFREYDPEIARWKSLDPKLKDFPSESPFSAMGNNPIMNTDVLGDSVNVSELISNYRQNPNAYRETLQGFETFLSTKEGKSWILDRAQKGFQYDGIIFKDLHVKAKKEGRLSANGIDVNIGSALLIDNDNYTLGSTRASMNYGRVLIEVTLKGNSESYRNSDGIDNYFQRVYLQTIYVAHELMYHADCFGTQYLTNQYKLGDNDLYFRATNYHDHGSKSTVHQDWIRNSSFGHSIIKIMKQTISLYNLSIQEEVMMQNIRNGFQIWLGHDKEFKNLFKK